MSNKFKLDGFGDALRRRRAQAALQKARDHFESYCEALYPGYKAAKHHKFIIANCERIERSEQPRTMISCPPQHGKSTTASHLFACWLLGRDPRRRVVIASYGDDRASDLGRAVLRTLNDPKHREIFPNCVVDRDAASTSRIELIQGGAFYATSRNGTLTGRPADFVILDDLLKDDREAKSPAVCREVIQFYTKVVLPRLGPTGAILLIGTRWGSGDIFNYLLTEQREETWEVVILPAFAGPNDPLGRSENEALWPEKYPVHVLQQKRAEMGGPAFTCLYQCDPTAAEGTVFHPEHWQYYSVPPAKFKQLILVVDSATKTAATNDYTVLQVWGETSTGFYLLHNWRGRVEYVALRTKVMEFFEQWRPRWVLIEDVGSGASLIQDLDASTSLPIKKLRPDRSKIARAESITPLIESGRVYLPQTAPWLNDFLDELHAFPRGTHDDQTDCVVYALQFFRGAQGLLKGWAWELIARHTELVKQNPGMSREQLALECGLVSGVPLHQVSLADAQMRAAEESGQRVIHFKRDPKTFGALETNLVPNNRARLPRSNSGPTQCPDCGNTNLSRYGDVQQCNVCKWDSRRATPAAAMTPPVPPPHKREGMLNFILGRADL